MKVFKRIILSLVVISLLVLVYNIKITYDELKQDKTSLLSLSTWKLKVDKDEVIANSKYQETFKPQVLKKEGKITEGYFDLELNYQTIKGSFMVTVNSIIKDSSCHNLIIAGYSENNQNIVKINEGTIPFSRNIYLKDKRTKKIRVYLSWESNSEEIPNLEVTVKLNRASV